MAETAALWRPRGAWAGIAQAGTFGAEGKAGVTVVTRDGLGIATLIASPDGSAALAAAVRERFGIELPQGPAAVRSGTHRVVWSGPGQWLLIGDSRAGWSDALAGLADHAAVVDQSDSRAVLSLSGPHVRDLLAKGCMIDLHPTVFPVGAAALTGIAHMAVALWRSVDGADGAVFEIMVARSMAGSFWSWLSASAAEFGCLVSAGPDWRSGRA
jgi:heterotetrameric sarcosine oxidase gamma subunit